MICRLNGNRSRDQDGEGGIGTGDVAVTVADGHLVIACVCRGYVVYRERCACSAADVSAVSEARSVK